MLPILICIIKLDIINSGVERKLPRFTFQGKLWRGYSTPPKILDLAVPLLKPALKIYYR